MEIYPGFAASQVLYKNGGVAGIATNDMGVAKSGARKETFQRGIDLRAKTTLFAEGCRGSLSEVGSQGTPLHACQHILHQHLRTYTLIPTVCQALLTSVVSGAGFTPLSKGTVLMSSLVGMLRSHAT